MKKAYLFLFALAGALLVSGATAAAEQPLWGPTKFDVKQRYGKDNLYPVSVAVAPGLYVIKLQNGSKPAERVDLLSFSVNGEQLFKNRHMEYNYLACIMPLQKENTFELGIRDYTPSPLKRPPAIPKNAVLSVVKAPVQFGKVVLGLLSWEDLNTYTAALAKIKSPESLAFAMSAADQRNETAVRAETMRSLGERKDSSALDYLMYVLNDQVDSADIRGQAAMALGMLGVKSSIPLLIRSVLDPEEAIRANAARALSQFPEQDTKDLLVKALERMDAFMSGPVVRSIVSAGWRPVSTLIGFAESQDPAVANMGVELLTGSQDPRVIELLLKYLAAPAPRDIRIVIRALGETKSREVITALTAIAQDPAKRRGNEVEIAGALATLGDPASEAVIADMIRNTEHWPTRRRLLESYRQLTGKEFNK